MSQTLKLTKDPIWFLLRKVTIPASIGSLFQTFYNLVDTWFAGRISAEAIAAIAKSFPIYFTIIAIGVGLTAGTNTLIGNNIGANNKKKSLIVCCTVNNICNFFIYFSYLFWVKRIRFFTFYNGIRSRGYNFIKKIFRHYFLWNNNSLSPNIFEWRFKRSRGHQKL